MGRLVEAISFCVFLLILNAPAFSQDDFLDAVIPAPNGRPALVKGMDGIWETPVEVYSDADLEMFIPKGAIVANVYYELAKFVETGNYYVAVYSYYKNERACRHWMAVGGADPKSANSCAELGYKQRILAVDMQRKMVKIPSVQFIDKRGKVDFVASISFRPATIRLASVDPATARALINISAIFARASHDPKMVGSKQAMATRRDSKENG